MKRWLLRMGLAVGLGWSLAAATGVGAQQPSALPAATNGEAPQDIQPVGCFVTPPVPIQLPPDPGPERTSLCSRLTKPFTDCWHRHGYHCYSELGWHGCTSCAAECTFIFGSCRQFFGEPCAVRPTGQPGAPADYGNGGCGCRP